MNDPASTILIVDDEPQNCKLLEALLRPEGYLTRSAASGADALASVALQSPDLILLDVMMPGMDGYEVARRLKANPITAHIPIIMLTALTDRAARMAGLDAGVEEFLSKPVDRAELWLRVRNLLRLKAFNDFLISHSWILEKQVQARSADLLRFRSAMDATADAIMMVSRNAMQFVEVNATACAMFGYTREELLQIGPMDIVGASVVQMASFYDQIIAGAAPATFTDTRAFRKDGSLFDVEIRRHAHRSGDDWIIVGVLRDTTERKRAEQALRHSEQRAQLVLNTAYDAFVAMDAQGRLTAWNLRAEELFGWSRDEALGRDLAETIIAPQCRAAHLLGLEQFAATGASATVNHAIELLAQNREGDEIAVEMSIWPDAAGQEHGFNAFIHDITERKDAARRLQHMAHYDALTGLPNRTLFYETLTKALALAGENGWQVAVLFIDLDYFKIVNDTLGHAVGDDLLRQFSDRLVQCVRLRDTVGRFGGDEFAIILTLQDGMQGAVVVANKIRDVLRTRFDLKGHSVTVTASIGITIHPDDASDPETLIKYGDTAMYRAKQAGRDTYRFFTAQMNADVRARLDLEIALRAALDNNEFSLVYQPKVQLSTGRVIGLEALLRWHRPGHGPVSPALFVPVLEEIGLIVPVGNWVIATACRQIALWSHSAIGPVQISVNVSGRQFVEGDLDAAVIDALRANAISPELLELELTESSLMANTERTIATLRNLKALGVHISIDDFGTGYSSLAYLRRFPIDKLKIDIAFVREVTTNPDDAAIALAIIGMAHSLKLEVIAEGVETEAQLTYLRRHRCDQIQGYYFSRPLPLPELETMLREKKCLAPSWDAADAPRQTLLLIDDEEHILTSLKRLLRQDDYHILAASSAAEGFELLALHDVQVILCDQRMPAMNGTEFLDRIKDMYPDTLRIVLSGYTDLESIMEAINRGAIYRFYTKPWDNKLLRDNVREAFRHHRLLHDVARHPRAETSMAPTLVQ